MVLAQIRFAHSHWSNILYIADDRFSLGQSECVISHRCCLDGDNNKSNSFTLYKISQNVTLWLDNMFCWSCSCSACCRRSACVHSWNCFHWFRCSHFGHYQSCIGTVSQMDCFDWSNVESGRWRGRDELSIFWEQETWIDDLQTM